MKRDRTGCPPTGAVRLTHDTNHQQSTVAGTVTVPSLRHTARAQSQAQ